MAMIAIPAYGKHQNEFAASAVPHNSHNTECRLFKEAPNNSSVNYQSKGNIKCDFLFPFIFNRLTRLKMAAHPCAAETLN
ncbi:MAG: hypothetical protein WBP02_12085, partial [Gammaproteobacteria bacterium]